MLRRVCGDVIRHLSCKTGRKVLTLLEGVVQLANGQSAATATINTKIPVIARGPVIVSKAGLVLDTTFNDATKKAAAYASLQAVGILVNDAV